jgi:polyphosphate kinase
LRPKIPGLSENIRVISIVGRFLEHSRIFHFENAGQPRVFLSSADWMPRNFYRRIELAFPVENPALRDQIINEVLPSFLHDRVKARELQPDGKYRRLKPEGAEPRAQAQWHFREVSRERAKKMTKPKKKLRADKLIPISVANAKPVAAAEREPGSSTPATTPKQSR